MQNKPILTDTVSESLIAMNQPVAIGVSGGKDSSVASWAVIEHLNHIGHTGPRLLVHSHLGRIEWQDSLPICEKLSAKLNTELLVVERAAGGMVERWQSRWDANLTRYRNLECVKLILPWSTPAMRFCTSELKTAIICRALIKRWPSSIILSASGIRREESAKRALKPITSAQKKLTSTTTAGYDWNPVADWKLNDVWKAHHDHDLPVHEAYQVYGSSRVSCSFCIMSSPDDLIKSSLCVGNEAVYVELCELEIESAFSFQGDQWLSDVAPNLLTEDMRENLALAKIKARRRREIEAWLPDNLLFKKGWPECVPTYAEAVSLAAMRREMADLIQMPVLCTTADTVIERYEYLLANKPKGKIEIPIFE